jgi:hypothetical protein
VIENNRQMLVSYLGVDAVDVFLRHLEQSVAEQAGHLEAKAAKREQ